MSNIKDQSKQIFSIDVFDKHQLYNIYMPFIKNSAIFIHTDNVYQLGDEVFLLMRLLEDPKKYPLAGRVAWITPNCAQGGRPAGIGVQFSDSKGQELQNKIDTYLAGLHNSSRQTITL